jgi:CMP-N-acetylneuraminic acid synthetase
MILVSTDDPAMAEEGRRAGAAVPFLRAPVLAGDTAAVIDAVRDALDRLTRAGEAAFDLIGLLEPTSPLRTPDIVRGVVHAAESAGADAALSLSPVPTHFHAFKQFTRTETGTAAFATDGGARVVNRQELRPTFVRNGMCYAVRATALAAGHGILGSAPRAVIIDGPYANIDEPADLEEARRLVAAGATPRAVLR